MIDWFRRLNYKRYEASVAQSADFVKFKKLVSGPWTPDMVSRMPWDVLLSGPHLGEIDAETGKIIDLEIEKRFRSFQPAVGNIIASALLIVAVIALLDITVPT